MFLKQKRKGSIIGNIQVAMLAVMFVVAALMAIGYMKANIPTSDLDNTTVENIDNAFNTGFTAIKLLVVSLIFLGIGAMIYIMVKSFGGGGR